jgi:predicted RNase H-like nuclease (RuvC/YqgF family)
MRLMKLEFLQLGTSVYIGEYKGKKAFIHTLNDQLYKIVLEDASHFYAELLEDINQKEIFVCVDDNKSSEKEGAQIAGLKEANKELSDELRCAHENNNDLSSQIMSIQQEWTSKSSRHTSQLESIFYMLEQLSRVGTHHEKEVVIRYIRQCIHAYIKRDSLDGYGDPDQLPF